MNATSEGNEVKMEGMSVASGMMLAFGMSYLSVLWSCIPWGAFFILLRYWKIRCDHLAKEDECKRIQRRIKTSSITADNNKSTGYAFGKWYILYLQGSSYNDEISVWMIATENSYQELVKESDDDEEDEIILPAITDGPVVNQPIVSSAKKFLIYDRRGDIGSLWYKVRTIKWQNYTPKPDQSVIMERIKQVYTQKGRGVFFVHGPPCSGKSHIGILLSDYFNGGYVNSFMPWTPGDSMAGLTADVETIKDKPIIVAFDEIDIVLEDLHNKKIEPHKKAITPIMDKSGWNRFFDNFQRGFFPNIIILMTSNRDPAFIHKMDTSYLASHRIDGIYELATKMD